MRKYLSFLILGIIIVLSACSSQITLDRLKKPINLEVHKNVLSFDPVFNAEMYIINANSVNIEVSETTYTFTEEGTYRVRVQAISSHHLDSLFSESVTVDVKYLEYPNDVKIVNNLIDFEKDLYVDDYLIEINGIEYHTISDIMPYLLPGTYDVRVKALSDTYMDSEYSPLKRLILTEDARLNTEESYVYSETSIFDLPLYTYYEKYVNTYEFEYIVKLKDSSNEMITKISASNLYVTENTVYLTNKFISTLEDTLGSEDSLEYQFILRTNLGTHEIKLTKTTEERPYVFTESLVQTNFHHDVTFGFELFNFKFNELTGHGITTDDYEFKNNILTIKQSFITKVFKSDFSKNELTFTYKIGDSYVGYIKISK